MLEVVQLLVEREIAEFVVMKPQLFQLWHLLRERHIGKQVVVEMKDLEFSHLTR